jgi:hypothetical protein
MSSKKNRKATTTATKAKRTRTAKAAEADATLVEGTPPALTPAPTAPTEAAHAEEAQAETPQATVPPEPEQVAAAQALADEALMPAEPTNGWPPAEPQAEVGQLSPITAATYEPQAVQTPAEPGATGTPPAPSATDQSPAPAAPAKPKQVRKVRQTEGGGTQKKASALDAAARVLGEEGQAMTCKELIAAMAAKGYWSSPGGKTPEATLYSAVLRELQAKGEQARFVKAERGKFALRTTG